MLEKVVFSQVLKRSRKSKNLTQEQLALNAGMSRNSVVNLEEGTVAKYP